MPTHQGKTQTDIVIGDGGDSATLSTELEWTLTTSQPVEVRADDDSGPLDGDATHRIAVLTATGGLMGALHVALRAAGTPSGATRGARTRADELAPLPAAGGVTWPTAPETSATRDVTASATGLGGLEATFEAATSAGTGVDVDQVVVSQTTGLLELHLTFRTGKTPFAEATVVCTSSLSATTSVTTTGPVVADLFLP